MSNEHAHTVRVELGDRAYDILIAPNALAGLGARLKEMFPGRRYAIVTDENVVRTQLTRLLSSLDNEGLWHTTISLPPGEKSKSFESLQRIVDGLISAKLERRDVVLAMGGGVVGDVAGFAAAVTRRGMNLVQIPTTLLAQVDSSIGGKTGINTPQGKNLVGAFHQPRLVVADILTLRTLPSREIRAGYAEVVKHALIEDAEFFAWLEANIEDFFRGRPVIAEAIARSCAIKARVVAEDERETTGRRALLNLGHTFGHALEAGAGFSDRLLHGEAVAIGCVLAHRFSVAQGLAPQEDADRVEAHFKAAKLPTRISEIQGGAPTVATLMQMIEQDKKVEQTKLTFVLTRGIGQAFLMKEVSKTQVKEFLEQEADR